MINSTKMRGGQNMIDVHISDDYAILNTTGYGFYYGYEFDTKECDCGDTEEIYGFEVSNDKSPSIFRISYEEMSKHYDNCPEQWDCEKCLLFGIGLWLDKDKVE